jgi:hypothetical protein
MIGAFFAMFASDNEHIALMVNMMTSVVSSAFTILFLFWSSSMILKKLISRIAAPNQREDKAVELTTSNAIVILGSSFVGSLALPILIVSGLMLWKQKFTLWLLYSSPCFFWLGLRWEQDMDSPRGNRWLLIISLVIGLSFGYTSWLF